MMLYSTEVGISPVGDLEKADHKVMVGLVNIVDILMQRVTVQLTVRNTRSVAKTTILRSFARAIAQTNMITEVNLCLERVKVERKSFMK